MKLIFKRFKLAMTIFILLTLLIIFSIYRLKDNFGKIPTAEESKRFENLDYYRNGHFMGNDIMVKKSVKKGYESTENFSIFGIFGKSKNAPRKKLPTIKPIFSEKPDNFAIYWLGHSSAILELDGKRILIDPVFGNASPIPFSVIRYEKPILKRRELPKIDYFLITHNHYDHLERNTIKYLKNKNIQFIVPLGVATALVGWGVNRNRIVELGWDDNYNVESITFTAVRGNHFSGRWLKDANKTLWNSYVIKSSNKNIFWSGDTGYGNQFKELNKKYGKFDLAAFEIDAWNQNWSTIHMFPYEIATICGEMDIKYLLPIHWGVFNLAMHKWNKSIELLLQEMKDIKNTIILTPKMGEKIDNSNLSSTRNQWWIDN